MTEAQRHVSGLVQKYGEDFTVGGSSRRGVFSNITPGNARAYLTQGQIEAAALPLWVCMVAYDDATVVGDTVAWNGRSLTVQNLAEARFEGGLAAKLLVLT